MPATHIAVLITCHNRCDVTLKCLHALYSQDGLKDVVFQVYLVDDGSTDGTAGEVKRQFPDIKIFQGDGNLYWCGGMRRAWTEAMNGQYDYFLWLNDDTMLVSSALETLICTAKNLRKQTRRECIMVGSTQDTETGEHTYGGRIRGKINKLVSPMDCPQPCDTINGNIVLIPNYVARLVGNFGSEFTHSIGDIDYGLRAKKLGVAIWVAPGFQGFCRQNGIAVWTRSSTPLRDRWRIMHTPKGLPPREYLIFLSRHHGWRWPIDMLKLYTRVFLPILWKWLKKA